jgi:3-hydroxybutyryl-CoA dehydrogenase
MTKVGIIGAGAMGAGIAQVAATAGHPVVLFDEQPAALEKARVGLQASLEALVAKGKLEAATAGAIQERISYADAEPALAGSQLVIEAIVENLEVKKGLFARLEGVVSDDCLLATNTSSLSVTAIAAACRKPERVLGIHFFNPAPLMRLVEVIPAVQTDAQVAEQARQLIGSWGKTTVLAKDSPGFIVNRIARPYYGEAIRLLEEGFADAATIDQAMTGPGQFRMGPFALMDLIGHDVNFTVTETMFRSCFHEPRYKPSFTQQRLVEAGRLGRKSGRGFYDYREGASRPEAAEDPALATAILDRIRVMLINEAADALFWGIATREDIDLAMTLGVNYPKGLLRWADELGIDRCVAQLDALYEEYREDRYRCSPLLRRMARAGLRFYQS